MIGLLEWAIWVVTIVLSDVGVGYYIRKYKKPDLLVGLYDRTDID